jgi:hypothetical protein
VDQPLALQVLHSFADLELSGVFTSMHVFCIHEI